MPVTRVRDDEQSARSPDSDLVEKAAAKAERETAGLSLSVQLSAPHWREHIVLALMRAVQDGARRFPGYPGRAPM